MSKHNSHKCEHKIELCAPCNTIYCSKCDYEWVERCTRNHWADYSWTTSSGGSGITYLSNHTNHASI